MDRRQVLMAVAAAAAGGRSRAALADTYPSQPVIVIVPFAAGGSLDVVARTVTVAMGKALNGTFVIENRAGASGITGTQAVARAAANGYMLAAVSNGSFIVGPKMVPRRPFALGDFAPIGMMIVTPMVLEVGASSRFATFKDFVGFARANPGRVSVGHPGNGTTNHLAILQLQQHLGTKFNIVPYRGNALAITDLLGGQIDALVDQLTVSTSHIKAGTVRPLGVTGKERAPGLPDVLTIAEQGLAGFDISTTSGLVAPAKTPPDIIAVLSRALRGALDDPGIQRQLMSMDTIPAFMAPSEYQTYLTGEDGRAETLAGQGLLKID